MGRRPHSASRNKAGSGRRHSRCRASCTIGFAIDCRSTLSTRCRRSLRAANPISSFPTTHAVRRRSGGALRSRERPQARGHLQHLRARLHRPAGPAARRLFDWLATDAVTARFGRFILPIGFAPEEVGSWTSKDMTRIQRLNAEANFGVMLVVCARRAVRCVRDGRARRRQSREGLRLVLLRQSDTRYQQRAHRCRVGARARRITRVDLRAAWKKGFTGSKVERLPSYWASKRNDDAIVLAGRCSRTSS